MTSKPYDLIGIGIGPFNLGLACLAHPIKDLDCLFLEQRDSVNWHEGTLLETATLQTPFLCDLVTLADPTSEFSFLSFLKKTGKIYAFYAYLLDTDNFFILRNQFNAYYRWAANQLDSLAFNRHVESIDYDEDASVYRVVCLNTRMGQRKTFEARHIVLGSGTVPKVPKACASVRDRLIHTEEYMRHRDAVRQKRSITVVGSGQSAAEVYHDLLNDIDRHGYTLNWITRSSRLVPRELTKLTLQVTTPDYARYFHALPRDKREALVNDMQAIFKGINPSLINDIFDLRFRKLLGGDVDTMIMSNSEIIGCEHDAAADTFRVTFNQHEEGRTFDLQTEALILGTGYEYRRPSYLDPIADRISWSENGRYKVAQNGAIDVNGGEVFVQNAETHADSFLPADLGQACIRNSRVIQAVLGKEHYPIEQVIAFQTFSAPSDRGVRATAGA